jgi:hypothetical protein
MQKKHFGVVAVTFVSGILVITGGGCSGAVDSGVGDSGGGSSSSSGGSSGATSSSSSSSGASGSSSGSSGAVDSGGKDASDASDASDAADAKDASDAGDGSVGICPTTVPIDATSLPWAPPFVAAGSCSQAELDALVAYVDMNPAAKYPDWKASVPGAVCSSCIFGKETDATWHPLLEDAAGMLVGLNVGGCIAIASGMTACGKSYQNWFDCRFEACTDCAAGDTAALQKCLTAASKGPCKAAFDAVSTVCGDATIVNAETACNGDKFVFEGPIKLQCIGL